MLLLYQRLLVCPSLITMRTVVLGLACVAVPAAFLPLPGNTQVACSFTFAPSLSTPTSRAAHRTVHGGQGATMGGRDKWCSRGIRLLNGSKLLLVQALLFDNILLLLQLLLRPLQRPIVVLLPLSSSCIDEWWKFLSFIEQIELQANLLHYFSS